MLSIRYSYSYAKPCSTAQYNSFIATGVVVAVAMVTGFMATVTMITITIATDVKALSAMATSTTATVIAMGATLTTLQAIL
ncbi:hypothetical protein EB796_005143 [Bugula neritina]|uniref:Uncharacterized protein n=1 Tax=Bugula neritina TaxID=10212 RepID=A0A7J7KCZ0_BUGNE|nr:hypothetical protein EB796_005143 [Bugula neritina]